MGYDVACSNPLQEREYNILITYSIYKLFLSLPNCASPELRLARIAPREYAVLFAALKRTYLWTLILNCALGSQEIEDFLGVALQVQQYTVLFAARRRTLITGKLFYSLKKTNQKDPGIAFLVFPIFYSLSLCLRLGKVY